MENSLVLMTATGFEIEPSEREALRYMGYRQGVPEQQLRELYDQCLSEFRKAAGYKAVFRYTDIHCRQDGEIDFGFCSIKSQALYKNLSDCRGAFIFAATAGIGVDRLLLRNSRLSSAAALVTDCIASSAIEVWCDTVNEKISRSYKTKPRFSPGYGGVELCCQRDILDFLDAERKTGIVLNETFMMKPVKSVTAIIGVKK